MACRCCGKCFNTLCYDCQLVMNAAAVTAFDWYALAPTTNLVCSDTEPDVQGLQTLVWICPSTLSECSAEVAVTAELRCKDGGDCGSDCVVDNLLVEVTPGACSCPEFDWTTLPYTVTAEIQILNSGLDGPCP